MGYIEDVMLTPLQIIDAPGGDVLHAMKCTDDGYIGFGEAYFSTVQHGSVKAWKRHREMTLNLIVSIGRVRFVIYDDRKNSPTCGVFQEITLSKENYARLTVPPLLWVGFQGINEDTNILLNIASVPHDPDEEDRRALEAFVYNWSLKT